MDVAQGRFVPLDKKVVVFQHVRPMLFDILRDIGSSVTKSASGLAGIRYGLHTHRRAPPIEGLNKEALLES